MKAALGEGPTEQRLNHAGDFRHKAGRSKSSTRYTMLDDALGRAWLRRKISDEEYYSLKRYAQHWAAAGFAGAMQSLDLDCVFAFDPSRMSGLAKSEAQQDHRDAYHAARAAIGTRLSGVADLVACFGASLCEVGIGMGYSSQAHARYQAAQALAEAGYRLGQHWRERDRRR